MDRIVLSDMNNLDNPTLNDIDHTLSQLFMIDFSLKSYSIALLPQFYRLDHHDDGVIVVDGEVPDIQLRVIDENPAARCPVWMFGDARDRRVEAFERGGPGRPHVKNAISVQQFELHPCLRFLWTG